MLDRRHLLHAALLFPAAPALARGPRPLPLPLYGAVKDAEHTTGGRIGLAVHDTATGRRFRYRGNERFAMASTFKALLIAAILARVDSGTDSLARAISIARRDIIANSPVSDKHVGSTATVAELCEATIIFSDNTAANLLLPAVGGPAGLTAWLRRMGDPATRLDRYEPMMSEALPGDPRDTTTPDAIAASLERLLLGKILTPASRQQLTRWLIANTTGDTRLRAGLPEGWKIGDKTGTGNNGTVNDIAVIWPARAAKGLLFIAGFITGGTAASDILYSAHADIASAVADGI